MLEKPTYEELLQKVSQLENELAGCTDCKHRLDAQRNLVTSLFDTLLTGITVWDHDGRLLLANRYFSQLTGYSKEEISSLENWFTKACPDPDHRSKVMADWDSIVHQAKAVQQFRISCKDETVKEIEFRGCLLADGRALVTLADCTAVKTLETQLIQSQKMEALGTLAGGIAHDYNNVLMGIHGNLSLVLLDFDGPADQLNQLKNIEKYIQGGVNLTQQLLSLTRGGHFQAFTADLNALVRQTADIFRRTKKQIKFHDTLDDTIKPVEIDPSQMEQVLLNLFINAWQAMPDGGSVTLTSSNATLDDAFTAAYHVTPGSYVKLSVADNGSGMDKITKNRVFDPFFTTKENGKGTGLGLSSTYNIVKNHGGIITVDSKLGKGSVFTLYLPASKKPLEAIHPKKSQIIKGQGTILLVDDEPMILDAGRQMLQQLGYVALTAGSGEEAMAQYQERMEEIQLVILDIIMPEVSGFETYKHLRQLDAGINVLLSSGYSVNGEAQRLLEMGCKGFIQKPFSLIELSRIIHDILK